MRSHELAALADVTVRTLRHYHHVGVLPEPERSRNGYREYTVHDLVQVLRVKRMAALGVALDSMRDILDSDGSAQGDLLTQLEAELDAKIAALTKQKQLLSLVRQTNAAVDSPPELARFSALLAVDGLSPELAKMDREQAILLAHLVGEEHMADLVGFFESLTEPDVTAATLALSERFVHLTDETPTDEVESFVRDVVEHSTLMVTLMSPAFTDAAVVDDRASALMAQHIGDALNPTQNRVLAELVRRLTAAT